MKMSLKEKKLIEEVRNMFKEQLSKYKNDIPQDPEGAASDLMKLIQKIIPIIEKSLEKAGPLVASSLLDDFKSDLNAALKNVKIPTQNKLSNIMADVEKKSKELEEKEK